jgi:hypothetical protein
MMGRNIENQRMAGIRPCNHVASYTPLWPGPNHPDRRRASTYRGVLWAACARTRKPLAWRGIGDWTGAMRHGTPQLGIIVPRFRYGERL